MIVLTVTRKNGAEIAVPKCFAGWYDLTKWRIHPMPIFCWGTGMDGIGKTTGEKCRIPAIGSIAGD